MQKRRQTCQVLFADQPQNVTQSLYGQRIEGRERTLSYLRLRFEAGHIEKPSVGACRCVFGGVTIKKLLALQPRRE